MSSSLSTLHPDIQFIIAAALGSDDNLPPRERYWKHSRSRDLPIGERERESKRKSRRNLINWSHTCKYFHSLLAPLVFHTVILRNDEKSAASVEAIIAARSGYANHVQELHFIGYAPGDAKRDDATFRDTENILPEEVKRLLIDLKRFPQLKGLHVEFDYNFQDFKEWEEEGVDPEAEIETMEIVREREGSEAWRALMVKVWEAISENKAGVIRKLVSQNSFIHSGHVCVSFQIWIFRHLAVAMYCTMYAILRSTNILLEACMSFFNHDIAGYHVMLTGSSISDH